MLTLLNFQCSTTALYVSLHLLASRYMNHLLQLEVRSDTTLALSHSRSRLQLRTHVSVTSVLLLRDFFVTDSSSSSRSFDQTVLSTLELLALTLNSFCNALKTSHLDVGSYLSKRDQGLTEVFP